VAPRRFPSLSLIGNLSSEAVNGRILLLLGLASIFFSSQPGTVDEERVLKYCLLQPFWVVIHCLVFGRLGIIIITVQEYGSLNTAFSWPGIKRQGGFYEVEKEIFPVGVCLVFFLVQFCF
jgi:hypothetical protein